MTPSIDEYGYIHASQPHRRDLGRPGSARLPRGSPRALNQVAEDLRALVADKSEESDEE